MAKSFVPWTPGKRRQVHQRKSSRSGSVGRNCVNMTAVWVSQGTMFPNREAFWKVILISPATYTCSFYFIKLARGCLFYFWIFCASKFYRTSARKVYIDKPTELLAHNRICTRACGRPHFPLIHTGQKWNSLSLSLSDIARLRAFCVFTALFRITRFLRTPSRINRDPRERSCSKDKTCGSSFFYIT